MSRRRYGRLCSDQSDGHHLRRVAITSLVAWRLPNQVLAVALSILCDVLVAVPSFSRRYRDPTSDSPGIWVAGAANGIYIGDAPVVHLHQRRFRHILRRPVPPGELLLVVRPRLRPHLAHAPGLNLPSGLARTSVRSGRSLRRCIRGGLSLLGRGRQADASRRPCPGISAILPTRYGVGRVLAGNRLIWSPSASSSSHPRATTSSTSVRGPAPARVLGRCTTVRCRSSSSRRPTRHWPTRPEVRARGGDPASLLGATPCRWHRSRGRHLVPPPRCPSSHVTDASSFRHRPDHCDAPCGPARECSRRASFMD